MMPRGRARRFIFAERGSISIFLVIILPLLLVIAGVATDISLLNAQKKHVQGQADMAAQSAVRLLPDVVAVRAMARDISEDNDRFNAPLLADADIIIGRYTRAGGFERAANQNSGAGVNAVRIVVPSPFRPMLLNAVLSDEDMTIRREAVAALNGTVVFSLRNRLLSLDTDQSVLSGLLRQTLGVSVNLHALGYDGLVRTNVGVNDLLGLLSTQVRAGVVTFDDVLNADVKLDDLLALVLPRRATTGLNVKLGTLLNVSPEIASAHIGDVLPDINLNAFEVLMAGVGLAGGDDTRIEVVTGLNLPGLAQVNLSLGAIRAAVTAVARIGERPPTEARIAQTSVNLAANVANGLLHLILRLTLVDASATAVSLTCGATQPTDELAVFRVVSGPASVALDVQLLNPGKFEPNRPIAPVAIAGQTKDITVTVADYAARRAIAIPYDALTISNLTNSLVNTLKLLKGDTEAERAAECKRLGALGCLLASVVGGVVGLLDGLLTGLTNLIANTLGLNQIVNNLLGALGIELAQAELIMHSYSCNGSRLVN